MLCMVVVSVLTATLAFIIKPVLDDVFIKKDLRMLKLIPIAICLIYVAKGLFDFVQDYLMNYVGQRIVADLRDRLYQHIQDMSMSFFVKRSTGELISRLSNDVNAIEGATSNAITGMLKDLFTIIALTGVVFYRDWRLALISFLLLPWTVIPIVNFGKKLKKIGRKSLSSIADITIILQETFGSSAMIVKAFCMEEYEKKRFSRENFKFFRLLLKRQLIRSISSPAMELLGGLAVAFIIAYGGYSVIKGYNTPGDFFSFIAALMMLYEPIKKLSKANNIIQQGMAAAERIFEILDTEPEVKDPPEAKELKEVRKSIEFVNVSFKYDGYLVLRNINLEAKVGEVIALVGRSGTGKSTLVNLIPRFYDVSQGNILIDDKDIRSLTLRSLRSKIAIVTQQSILFNDTIRNNIAYGDITKSEEEIIRAAKLAYAHDFIMPSPKGYDTIIGEEGVKLSGGERQRICIARAILKDAPILILDEATSFLDSQSEEIVQRALENLMRHRTTFVVAHRLSTVQNADRILVLNKGQIVEEGRHAELLKLNGEYKRLYSLQFRRETKPKSSPSADGLDKFLTMESSSEFIPAL